jgi:hypothetical protein
VPTDPDLDTHDPPDCPAAHDPVGTANVQLVLLGVIL